MCRDESCIRECKQWVQVEVGVYRISQVCNPPAPVRHRSRTRSQPVRGHRHSRTSVYRWSKIGRVAHTPICVQRPRGPKSRGPVKACPVVPWLSATLPDRAPAHASPADPIYRWSKIGRVARPHQYACLQASGRPKSLGPVTACSVAPSLSATLPQRAPARASTAGPVYRWSKIGRVARPRQYACNDRGGPKSLGPVR